MADRDVMTLQQEVRRLSRIVDKLSGSPFDLFPAQLTSGTGPYAWTERAFDENGDRYDKPGGRYGTTTYQWAEDPNGASFSPPTEVWLKGRVVVGAEGLVYDIFGSPGASAASPTPVEYSITNGLFLYGMPPTVLATLTFSTAGTYTVLGHLYRNNINFGTGRPEVSLPIASGTATVYGGFGTGAVIYGNANVIFGAGTSQYDAIALSWFVRVTAAPATATLTYTTRAVVGAVDTVEPGGVVAVCQI